MKKTIRFDSLRSDWYSNNSVLPGLFRKALSFEEEIVFEGFPRQWLPIFEYFGVRWHRSIEPRYYIPIFSNLTENQLLNIICCARKNRSLRNLVESTTIYDPILSDFLYIIDNTLDVDNPIEKLELESSNLEPKKILKLNGWQSYGRKSIRNLEAEVDKIGPKSKEAIALPCALKRPYHLSRTHKRIYNILEDQGYNIVKLHKIVVTSLGILPEEVWSLPQVLYYDAGVPDIYRILRLARVFFKRCAFSTVFDCLSFEPFSDVLRIVQREGLIGNIQNVKIPGRRPFYVRP